MPKGPSKPQDPLHDACWNPTLIGSWRKERCVYVAFRAPRYTSHVRPTSGFWTVGSVLPGSFQKSGKVVLSFCSNRPVDHRKNQQSRSQFLESNTSMVEIVEPGSGSTLWISISISPSTQILRIVSLGFVIRALRWICCFFDPPRGLGQCCRPAETAPTGQFGVACKAWKHPTH